MPFDSKTASAAGKVGGKRGAAKRWADKDPNELRNKPLLLKLSQGEIDAITSKAKEMEISRVELIVRAVTAYE